MKPTKIYTLVGEPEVNVGYLEVLEGHCWKCHEVLKPKDIHLQCLSLPVTECTKERCGDWYDSRVALNIKHSPNIEVYGERSTEPKPEPDNLTSKQDELKAHGGAKSMNDASGGDKEEGEGDEEGNDPPLKTRD